jgi:hypothetical protein
MAIPVRAALQRSTSADGASVRLTVALRSSAVSEGE